MRVHWKVTSLVLLGAAAVSVAADYEKPGKQSASEVLSAEVVDGERYTVEDRVMSDGYMNSFVIDSDYGKFEAYGERTLMMRIHEIKALGELDELSKSEVFVKSVGEGAIRSLKGFEQILENPVDTAKGLPGGAKRFFKRTKHQVEGGYNTAKDMVTDDEEQGEGEAGEEGAEGEEDDSSFTEEAKDTTTAYAKKYFGVNSAQRRWAQKLEVDPYTSNQVLREALKDVAQIDAAGRFAVRLAPIPRIPGAKYANTVTSLVWTREPWELVEENKKALLEAGASEEQIEAFFANTEFSPTLQTAFVRPMLELKGAQDLAISLQQAATAESESEALFFVQGALMLRWFHHKESPIAALIAAGERVFAARSEDGRVVIMLPVDHLFWTREMAEAVEGANEDFGSEEKREMWFAGGVSDQARSELEALGWTARTEMAVKMKRDPVQAPDQEQEQGD